MQTRSPPGSLNRRLAPQGWWGNEQDSEEEEGGGGGGRGLEKQVHCRMDDICYTMFLGFP